VAACSLVHSKTDTCTRRKECCLAPTQVLRSISHTQSPSLSPSLHSTDKMLTKADFVIGKQTPAMEQQPADSSVGGHSTMPPSAPAGGQTTNNSSGSPPNVLTVQDAGQAMMPARPIGATAPLPILTEVASSPMPASASQTISSLVVALLPTGPTQSSTTPSPVVVPSTGTLEENRLVGAIQG